MEKRPREHVSPPHASTFALDSHRIFPYDRCMAENRSDISWIHIALALAIVFRIVLMFNPGFEADISFWKSWGLATYDKGIVEGMKVTNNNYPTPFAYVLGGMVGVYSLLANPHDFNAFWTNTNLLFLTISKMVPVLADFGIAFLLFYIGKHAKSLGFPEGRVLPIPKISFYQLAAIVYLLSPLSLADGAWWGQVDALGIVIFLVAILAALFKRPFWAGAIFMLAMMTKLQNMIYGPIFFLYIWQTMGFEGLMRAICGATVSFFGLNIEFFLTRNMDRVVGSLTENFDYFPWMSLNAYNLWWIVSGGHGMAMSDKVSVLGLLNAKTVGLVLFSGMYLFAVVQQFLPSKKTASNNHLYTFLTSLILVNAAFFLFQSQSHDRYAFPLSVFLLLWAPFFIATSDKLHVIRKKIMLFATFYSLFTLFYFYNLHTALIINYPNNGLPILSRLTQPIFTIPASYILIGLFGIFLFVVIRTSRSVFLSFLAVLVVMASGLMILNLPLIRKQSVSLNTITPYISEQGYGTRQTNRSVQSGFGGPNSWTRLSVQYVFYTSGIGTHANSRIVYNIHKNFRIFETDFGIDTEAGTKASSVFEIYGDNKLLFRSPAMGRFDLPKHASVNVTNVNNLTLITTDAGDGNFDDHTDWLNPVLLP